MLLSIASARFGNFRYRAAMQAYLEARRRAIAAGDVLDAGAIDANLSSLYLQVWDFESSVSAADRALAERASLTRTGVRPYFEAGLMLHLGRLHEILGDGQGDRYFLEGIEAARAQNNIPFEAKGWDYYGSGRLAAGDLAGAERALVEAFRLRTMFDRAELPFSWALLGRLKLAQRDLDGARIFTDRALNAAASIDASYPSYLLLHQRGEIRKVLGDRKRAVNDFASAVDLATRWRREVPPSAASLTAANIALEQRVFDSFIDEAAAQSVATGDRSKLEQSLVALEMNRSASLRENLNFAATWRSKLNPEYWEVQAQLRAESARLLRTGEAGSSLSDQLNLKLSEMEAETKLKNSAGPREKIRSQISLIHFQSGLGDSDLLLVLHLGSEKSFLWAVTRDDAALQSLPPAGILRPEIEQFRDAVRLGRSESLTLGANLYQRLFGNLPAYAIRKKSWLLSVDDALFDLPFAALVTGDGRNRMYLVQKHSVEMIQRPLAVRSGAVTLDAKGWFLGVGDPIYNRADPRLAHSSGPPPRSGWSALAATADEESNVLNRLVASGTEIESSARQWSGTSDNETHGSRNVLLRGPDAARARFVEEAGRGPSVIHLATHVVAPRGRRDQAMIAFTMGPQGEPEFLTISDIATMHVPGALVVMSGCETGAGIARAGAGLLGLSRAWQMAGAGAVLSTAWPVLDSTGEIFSTFYRHLRAVRAAEALRMSQIEMIQSGTWRSAPSYWAAYQLSAGGVQ